VQARILVAVALTLLGLACAFVVSARLIAGTSAGRTVSALDRLPPAASLPTAVYEWAGVVGRRTPRAQATRLLRADLGGQKSRVYAFRNAKGGVCFLNPGYAGSCSTAEHLRRTGAQWLVGAGRFVAVVTDDVDRVALSVDETVYPVSIANNVAFAEFPSGGASAQIDIWYANGSTQRSTVQLATSPPAELLERLRQTP
jgi:hypothetical protein